MIKVSDVQYFKAARAAAAKSDVRYYLNGLLFTKGGFVVGTNGHVLVKVECTDYEGEDIILNFKGAIPVKTFSITLDVASKIVTFLGVVDNEIEIRRLEIIDGKYPDLSKTIPAIHEDLSPSDFAFNASLLSDIQKQGKFMGFKFNMSKPTEAILFTPESEFNSKFTGVIMPMRM